MSATIIIISVIVICIIFVVLWVYLAYKDYKCMIERINNAMHFMPNSAELSKQFMRDFLNKK